MDLILWRHADAEEPKAGADDMARALTAKGYKQARKAGGWLDANLPESCRVIASPAVRSLQTAEALGRKFRIMAGLAPDATPEQVLAAANWPNSREPVLVIGHQPALGQVAALLLAGAPQPWHIRKAGIWWISPRGDDADAGLHLRAMIAPDMIVK